MASSETFFKRLTRLFRSGPAIQRRIKGNDSRSYYNAQLVQGNFGYKASAPFGFGRENSPFSVLGSYGLLDRMARYGEFGEMEYMPEIAAALDIYADETVGGDDRGKAFHVYSDNIKIKSTLEDLFYDILNVEFNLKMWTRNICKYGDFFLYTEVHPDVGVVNVTPIAVNEVEREEGFDLEDPYAVRFKWLTRGNKYLENWQVAHFRILGNDLFLPYGTSVLESSRRLWRQLQMLEDAMLVYRVVRSPERRVFFIDVGNVAPNDVPNYMDAAKATLRSRSSMDRETGREDQRFNSTSMLDDYFIPVRGNQQGTRVETLSGGAHVTATEDIEYIQRKLFAALKVPKPYLNFDENLSAKASLAQMDVRFSRTIQGLQKILISELNKIAMIHLFSMGFDGEDLVDFELKLSNPSSVALQQKLELWQVKFDIGGTAKETKLVDERWVQKNILELTDDEINLIERGLLRDKGREMQIEAMELQDPDPLQPSKTTDAFDPTAYGVKGKDVPKTPAADQDQENSKIARTFGVELTPETEEEDPFRRAEDTGVGPIKASPFLTRNKKNRSRRMGSSKGRQNTAMPDMHAMLSPKNKYTRDIYGQRTEGFNPMERDPKEDYAIQIEPQIDKGMRSIMKNLRYRLDETRSAKKLLQEQTAEEESEKTIDLEIDMTADETDLILENIENQPSSSDTDDPTESIEETSLSEVFNRDS